jgi:hypothetical protein
MSIMTQTTLSAAVSATADKVVVASASGISVGSVLMVDSEFMQVTAIDGTTLTIARTLRPGAVTAHASGAPVFIGGNESMGYVDKVGYDASPAHTLVININNGKHFVNVGGYWFSASGFFASRCMFDIAGSGSATDGTSGTGVGLCGPGSTYMDYGSGILYVNTGTKASPVWVLPSNAS